MQEETKLITTAKIIQIIIGSIIAVALIIYT